MTGCVLVGTLAPLAVPGACHRCAAHLGHASATRQAARYPLRTAPFKFSADCGGGPRRRRASPAVGAGSRLFFSVPGQRSTWSPSIARPPATLPVPTIAQQSAHRGGAGPGQGSGSHERSAGPTGGLRPLNSLGTGRSHQSPDSASGGRFQARIHRWDGWRGAKATTSRPIAITTTAQALSSV